MAWIGSAFRSPFFLATESITPGVPGVPRKGIRQDSRPPLHPDPRESPLLVDCERRADPSRLTHPCPSHPRS